MELELACPLRTHMHHALQSDLFSDFPICTPSWMPGILSLHPAVHPFINHMFDSPQGLAASSDSRVLWWERLDGPQTLSNTATVKWVRGKRLNI